MSWLRRAVIKKLREGRMRNLHDRIEVVGRVEVIMHYSELYRNPKLRGEVAAYHDTGRNLVVIEGRRRAVGLILGSTGIGAGLGYNDDDNTAMVVRGMGLGEDQTPEADEDSASIPAGGLHAPSPGNVAWDHYFPLTGASFPSGVPAESGTAVTFTRVFNTNEPDPLAPTAVREFGLYTACPGGGKCPQAPAGTTPIGPSGGPYLVARKTHDTITKDPNFTMTVNWTLEY